MNNPASMALIFILVFQGIATAMVMRGLNERPDLAGLQRLIPLVLCLGVPVFGPLIASRLVDVGFRPVVISALGVLVGVGIWKFGAPPGKPGTKTAAKADGAKADPAKADASKTGTTPADAAKADPTKLAPAGGTEPAKPGQPTTPTPAPAVPAGVTPQPGAPQPGKLAEAPAPAPAPTPVANPTTPGAPVQVTPVAGVPVVSPAALLMDENIAVGDEASEGKIVSKVWTQGAKNLGYLKLEMAAAITKTPTAGAGGSPQFYVGGTARNFTQQAIDRFGPREVADSELTPGYTFYINSRRSMFQAEVRVNSVTKGPDGHVNGASLTVRVR